MPSDGQASTDCSSEVEAWTPNSKIGEDLLKENPTPEQFCAELAKIFRVQPTEVALLRVEKNVLRFLFPEELKSAGTIPLTSSSAVAAHTALTKKVELYNGFLKVKHASVFETVKMGKPKPPEEHLQSPIQKLMSAPIVDAKRTVLGVIQISRKGTDPCASGPDFTLEDLQHLEQAAWALATAPFMQPEAAQK